MESDAFARLKRLAGKSTLILTHYGRKSGKPYEVKIWFDIGIVGRTSRQEYLRWIGQLPPQLIDCALQNSEHPFKLIIGLLAKIRFSIVGVVHAALRRTESLNVWMFIAECSEECTFPGMCPLLALG